MLNEKWGGRHSLRRTVLNVGILMLQEINEAKENAIYAIRTNKMVSLIVRIFLIGF
jgi:hypothetical protein